MEENKKKSANKKRPVKSTKRKKQAPDAFDTYLANISAGQEPPSAKKPRRKKQDPDAYDAFLNELEKPELSIPKMPQTVRKRKDTTIPNRKERAGADGWDDESATGGWQNRRGAPHPIRMPRRHKTGGMGTFGWIYTVTAVFVLVYIGLACWQQAQAYTDYRAMRSMVDNQRFYEGTTVGGYDVSGLTLSEASERYDKDIEASMRSRVVTLSTGEMFTSEQLGYQSNYLQVLRVAFSKGRKGTLEERYLAIMSGSYKAADYSVDRVFYDGSKVAEAVQSVAQHVNTGAGEPKMTGFDASTQEFTFEEGKAGKQLDEEQLTNEIINSLNSGGGGVEVCVNDVKPTTKVADIKDDYGQISFMSTSASSSGSARVTNLKLACQALNGLKIEPGEEFSFNGTLGKRTTEKGYKEAPVYQSGTTATGVGGGICQVASTLFNTAVKADMKITQRGPHSLPVHYLDLGVDCAINWPKQDLKFKNTSDVPVYIAARVTKEKKVQVAIYGKLLPNGEKIELKGVKTETIESEIEFKTDSTLAPGETITEDGHDGYRAEAYKIRYDAKGNKISEELFCKSYYPMKKTVIYISPN